MMEKCYFGSFKRVLFTSTDLLLVNARCAKRFSWWCPLKIGLSVVSFSRGTGREKWSVFGQLLFRVNGCNLVMKGYVTLVWYYDHFSLVSPV